MNRSLVKILIAIWLVIAVALTGFLAYAIYYNKSAGDVFSFFKWRDVSASTVQKDENIPLDSFNKINVDFSSADVIVQTTDEPNLRVVQKASSKLKEEQKFTISKENNTVTIKRNTSEMIFNIFNFGNFGEKIEVYIPKTYTKDLDIRSASGDVVFNSDIELNNINCFTSSGDFYGKNNISANNIILKSSSGDISIGDLISKSYKVDISSGDIKINSLSGSGEVEAASGDITISYKDINEYSNVSAQSGNVKLLIPKELSFQFTGKCSSGDINSNFDLNYKSKRGNEAAAQVGSGPYKKINANTNSGDIDIRSN